MMNPSARAALAFAATILGVVLYRRNRQSASRPALRFVAIGLLICGALLALWALIGTLE
jgi:hypothetical protein